MKLLVPILLLCAVSWAEGFKLGKQGQNQDEECCYPRPPPRKDRGFKRHASQCCEVPVAEIFEKFSSDLEACKEENHKKPEEQSTTTTAAPPPPPDKDNEFDAEPSDSMENEDTEEAVATTTPAATTAASTHEGRHHEGPHKGKKGGKHHHHGQRGKCMRETMEKHGWSQNGTINWEVIRETAEKALTETGKQWVPVVREAITNCSQHAAKAPPAEESTCPHHQPSAEKQAWRCIINSSIMNCPNFPEDNEYCVRLRDVYQRCSSQPYGPKHVRWCKSGRNNHKNKKTEQVA